MTTSPAHEAYEHARRDIASSCVTGPRAARIGPFEELMQRKYNDGLATGLIMPCPHVADATQLMWFPVDGCPAGCRHCVGWWVTGLGGTDEDTRCDVCGAGPNRPADIEQRHLILSVRPPGLPAKAVTVVYMVCRGCRARHE